MAFAPLEENKAADWFPKCTLAVIASVFPAVLASSRGIHFAAQSSRGTGSQGNRSLPTTRSGAAPKTHRDYHGRQRALGQAAPYAARGRAPRRSRGRAVDGRDG